MTRKYHGCNTRLSSPPPPPTPRRLPIHFSNEMSENCAPHRKIYKASNRN